MKKFYTVLLALLAFIPITKGQNNNLNSPCSDSEIIKRISKTNTNALFEFEENEAFTQEFVKQLKKARDQNKGQDRDETYIIPVVLHVFHYGDDAKIDLAQAQSGIDILNTDFNGLNSDWNTIDSAFDGIKATLDIQFCLASIDPFGNQTSGVIYYEDSAAMLNNTNLFQYAWDNHKYLNIYLPKYTQGEPSLFTAYAYYPSLSNTNNNTDGVFYSSIRWGYGTHSELTPGQEWASVGTHELGHWLNLRHTFENGCSPNNDLESDTPPTLGGTIELTGCYNNDFSCDFPTNGENYMDYNHDCKKMFTQGQVDRMTAALQLPARNNLWTLSNLIETGCAQPTGLTNAINKTAVNIYPNPSNNLINFEFENSPTNIQVFDIYGNLILMNSINFQSYKLYVNDLAPGVYFYQVTFNDYISKGKFVVN